MKPSDYRKIYQQLIGKDSKLTKVDVGKVAERIEYFVNVPEDHIEQQTEYKVSMTPITLKNIGSKTDLLSCLKQDGELFESEDGHPGWAENTYAVIRLSDNGNAEHDRRLLEKLLHEFQNKAVSDIEYWFIK